MMMTVKIPTAAPKAFATILYRARPKKILLSVSSLAINKVLVLTHPLEVLAFVTKILTAALPIVTLALFKETRA